MNDSKPNDKPEPRRFSAVTFSRPVRVGRHTCPALPLNDRGHSDFELYLEGPFLRVVAKMPDGDQTKLVPLSNVVDLTPWTPPKQAP